MAHSQEARNEQGYVERLVKAREGDPNALHWLICAEMHWLHNLVRRKVLFSGIGAIPAEEVVQETLLRVLSSAVSPAAQSRARFRSWLGTIATNTLIDRLRRSQCTDSLGEHEDAAHAESKQNPPLSDQRTEDLEVFRTRLSFREEAIIVLHSYCGIGHTKLAQLLGCDGQNGVYCLHARTLQKVRNMATGTAMPY